MDGAFEDENENEQSITIDEYLNGVEEEELEADLVLGGDEGKECTYNMGYMKRQAIFSCLTCTPDGNAGVCTACSLSCHDGHEIVELWTKRNFRCDCGNSKFGEFFCKLFPQKEVENSNNSYNQNFKGSYCTCGRPYPDPDVEDQEEMIQCIACEDWFHEKHIGLESSKEIPRDGEGEPLYDDFICKTCSTNCSFLTLYPQNICSVGGKSVDVTANDTSKAKNVLEDTLSATGSGKLENDKADTSPNESAIGEISEKTVNSDQIMEDANLQTTCVLGVDSLDNLPVLESKPLFLSKNWREMLCKCEKCLDMYNQKKISYLIDKEDSIAEYEKMAKQKRDEKLQKQEVAEMSLFNNLGHVEKIEILNGIADFKDEFRTFLESFDTSKTITSSDVHQIFENLAKKRRRE
ncbi:PHD finger protein-related [Euphorbia peplus]|nr:PHD finger protein-related [Euphorbia peplus]